MRALWPVWIGCLCAAVAPALADDGQRYAARVLRVFDGDTIWVQPADGSARRKLRLDGLDAPEICQPGGEASRDALAARVLGQVVWVSERAQDGYGRGIAVLVTASGEEVNRALVQQGQAWAQRWRGRGVYLAEEDAARRSQRGLFHEPGAEPPRDFRRRHGACENPPRSLSVPR